MAFKSWLVGLAPTDTRWEDCASEEEASFHHRRNSTPELFSEAGTMRIAAADTINTRAHSTSPVRQPTLEWKRRLVDGNVGYGDQTSLFGPSGLENMFMRPQTADDDGLQKVQTTKSKNGLKKTAYKTRSGTDPSIPPLQYTWFERCEQEQDSPRTSTSSSVESELLASLCEGMDLVAMRTATIKKALTDFLDAQKQLDTPTKRDESGVLATELAAGDNATKHSIQATDPAAGNNATERSIQETNLENISPVVVAKRTTIDGKVSYNAYSPKKARAEIIQERRGIDKTETSQRAREVALAMGDDTSAVSGAVDGSFMSEEARNISGFTDAPEVEFDKPNKQPTNKDSASWDFTDPPVCESSELAAAARARGNRAAYVLCRTTLGSSISDNAAPLQRPRTVTATTWRASVALFPPSRQSTTSTWSTPKTTTTPRA